MIRLTSLLAALVAASGAGALDLPGNARLTAERVTAQDRYNAPIGPYDGASIPVQAVDGTIVRRAWRIPGVTLTPLQVLAPLRAQYEAAGYGAVLDCMADRCGGFDFRFGTEVLPAPAMFVNLQSYHVVTLRKGPADAPAAVASLLASTGANVAHLQIIEARAEENAGLLPLVFQQPADLQPAEPDPPDPPFETTLSQEVSPPMELAEGLATLGFHVLEGLEFDVGATALGPGPFPVLAQLAAFLTENPGRRVALVGHTDTVGTLDSNIAISRTRARSVRQRLIDAYGVEASQLDADGMGYLAPRFSNLTAEGREANRRVEAVLLHDDRDLEPD